MPPEEALPPLPTTPPLLELPPLPVIPPVLAPPDAVLVPPVAETPPEPPWLELLPPLPPPVPDVPPPPFELQAGSANMPSAVPISARRANLSSSPLLAMGFFLAQKRPSRSTPTTPMLTSISAAPNRPPAVPRLPRLPTSATCNSRHRAATPPICGPFWPLFRAKPNRFPGRSAVPKRCACLRSVFFVVYAQK